MLLSYCKHQLTTVGTTPFLHGSIRPINALTARPASSGIKVLRAICTKIVEEDDEYGNDLADP